MHVSPRFFSAEMSEKSWSDNFVGHKFEETLPELLRVSKRLHCIPRLTVIVLVLYQDTTKRPFHWGKCVYYLQVQNFAILYWKLFFTIFSTVQQVCVYKIDIFTWLLEHCCLLKKYLAINFGSRQKTKHSESEAYCFSTKQKAKRNRCSSVISQFIKPDRNKTPQISAYKSNAAMHRSNK